MINRILNRLAAHLVRRGRVEIIAQWQSSPEYLKSLLEYEGIFAADNDPVFEKSLRRIRKQIAEHPLSNRQGHSSPREDY